MVSTFHGLEVAKGALNAQQSALYTTSHNIANANTKGYSRQRVNFEQVSSLAPGRNPGQNIGAGVKPGSVERIRDLFLDEQYRKENASVGYYDQIAKAMSQMETIMNEPSEEGLAFTMNQFWDSLQDLAVNPTDQGARSVVSQRAQAVADTFNYASDSLEAVRRDLKNQMDVTAGEFNSLVSQINNVNQQVAKLEPHGHVPNDLYDERDRLLDQLSSIADISVSYTKSSGQPNDIAMGKATVTLNGAGSDIVLVDGTTNEANHMFIEYDENNNVTNYHFYDASASPTSVADLPAGSESVTAAEYQSIGSMLGLMEMNGFLNASGEEDGAFNQMLDDLDTLATAFAKEFNAVHQAGFDLDGEAGIDFFTIGQGADERAAATIQVNQEIIDDQSKIAASSTGSRGDGGNASNLARAYTTASEDLNNQSPDDFYQSIIGQMGVKGQEANRMVSNSQVLRQQVQNNRESVSSVSLDEEMINLIKFQHAYNAAARSMTSVDEMLDTIINRMGLVGR